MCLILSLSKDEALESICYQTASPPWWGSYSVAPSCQGANSSSP